MIDDRPYSVAKKVSLYFRFLRNSKNRHSIHSPFVYDFIENVLRKKYTDDDVEIERKKLLKDKSRFFFEDLGTGQDRETTVSRFASTSLKKRKEAELLARIITYYSFESILELGSSFGITTAYLARTRNKPNILSIEGSKLVLNKAQSVWDQLSIKNIKSINGDFSTILPDIIKDYDKASCFFIDGNHRYSACINYFNIITEKITPKSIIIVDDIYWSEGMNKAWIRMINDSKVKLSIDLFEFGILFFDQRLKKEHFVLRY